MKLSKGSDIRVSLTGHRPEKMTEYERYTAYIWIQEMGKYLHENFQVVEGLSGMARGADMVWAKTLLDLGIPLWAHIPYWKQTQRWDAEEASAWRGMMQRAADVSIYGKKSDGNQAIWDRNRGLIEHADLMLVVCGDTSTGGTAKTWQMAKDSGIAWLRYNPTENVVSGSDHFQGVTL